MANRPIFPGALEVGVAALFDADTTDIVELFQAKPNGARVNNVSVTSTDTVNATVLVYYLTYEGLSLNIASVVVPAGAGTDGSTPAVSLFNSTDMPFLPADLFYYVRGDDYIGVSVATTLSAGKNLFFVASLGEY